MTNLNFYMTNGEVITLRDITLEIYREDILAMGLNTLFYRNMHSELDHKTYIGLQHVIKIEEVEE